MPVSLEEVLLYTEAELEAKVRQLLRPGEMLTITLQDGKCWSAEVTTGEGDEFKYHWDSIGFDRRLLLLDAFGWIWSRSQTVASPLWTRRQEVSREAVARRASREPFPDPEDLDPAEVESVYERFHQHGKKD